MSETSVVRGYLLGELAEDRSAELEQALLVDRELLLLLEDVERDLIDDYVGERLSDSDEERFDQYYLVSPLHHDRVMIARRLLRCAGPAASAPVSSDVTVVDGGWLTRIADAIGLRPRVLGWATAAVMVAIAGGLAVTSWRGTVAERAETPVAADMPPAPVAPLPDDRARPAANPARVALVLPAISMRSRTESTPRVSIAPGVEFVDLMLESGRPGLADAVAEVRSVDDRVVWTGRSAAPPSGGSAAVVSVPAARLTPDDYIVALVDGSGAPVARYFFRVASDR